MFGYDAEEYIKMGKPGLEDLADEKVEVDENEKKDEVVDIIQEKGDEVIEVLSDKKL